MKNRFYRKQLHKLRLKKHHANQFYFGRYTINAIEDRQIESNLECLDGTLSRKWYEPRNNGYTYWDTMSRSGSKKFAKQQTNRRIRAKYKVLCDESVALRNADYQKEFDYAWTVW